jgi:hypothetical protein
MVLTVSWWELYMKLDGQCTAPFFGSPSTVVQVKSIPYSPAWYKTQVPGPMSTRKVMKCVASILLDDRRWWDNLPGAR